ncbi:MAG: hypothetical protein M1825_000422 [Sarcosagium campestre]|nr:MAG: hypothetical protein M1825_000422 [Sarcosagium campestre]
MADEATSVGDAPITFNVKSSSDAKYVLTLPSSVTVLELKTKLAGSEYADLPADRQRLIYSGRVLKDAETLESYKIKDGHTIHLVRSAASNQRQNPASSPSASTAGGAAGIGGVPTNLAAGTGNDPLAALTGARLAGHAQLPGAGLFGPDGGMGAPPNPEQMQEMLANPAFASTLNEALQNDQILDTLISSNPMLRDMGPMARQMIRSPQFREMLTNPETLRNMTNMQRMMGLGQFGGAAGQGGGGFPAPGITDTTQGAAAAGSQAQGQAATSPGAPPTNPFAFLNDGAARQSAGTGPGNPFAALFSGYPGVGGANPNNPSNTTNTPTSTDTTSGSTPNPTQAIPPNPFLNNPLLQNPEMMQQMLAMMGGGQAGSPAPPAPVDNRPPEDRYADQLRQLNDMGFYDFDRNVAALRRTGGSVQGAVEYLLSNP